MQIKPQKTILLRFPDSPEVKSSNKFSYNQNINGLEFLDTSFKEIHETFEKLCENYGAKPVDHQVSISLDQLGDLRPARDRTLAFSFEKNISVIDGKNNMHLSGWGCDQLLDLRLSFRKYFLDDKGLGKAKKYMELINIR